MLEMRGSPTGEKGGEGGSEVHNNEEGGVT